VVSLVPLLGQGEAGDTVRDIDTSRQGPVDPAFTRVDHRASPPRAGLSMRAHALVKRSGGDGSIGVVFRIWREAGGALVEWASGPRLEALGEIEVVG
jgi:hypothetical protein